MFFFFFFKQKTAYEIRPCDWSSDVCSADLLGRARTLRSLLAARLITAEEAHESGFVADIVDPADLDTRLAELTADIARCAPLTLAALKEADRRVLAASAPGHAEDLYARVYGSRDFAEGVTAFLEKRKPEWE